MNIAALYPTPFDSQFRHDSNVSILSNGKLYAYEESKLRGTKNDEALIFPLRSLLYGLKELSLNPQDIDKWLFCTPLTKPSKESFQYFFCSFLKVTTPELLDSYIKEKVSFVPHHLAHIYLGFAASPFKKSLVISMDGGGDGGDNRNAVWGSIKEAGDGFSFTQFGALDGYSGLAKFHDFLTDVVGFGDNNGKTSGLAAYGKVINNLYDQMLNYISVNDSHLEVKIKRRSSKFNLEKLRCDLFETSKYVNSSPSDSDLLHITKTYKVEDVAATGEKLVKDLLVSLVNRFFPNETNENLICVGGLFNNVSINQHLKEHCKFKNVFFSMAPGDSGLSLGLAASSARNFKSKYSKHFSEFGLSPYLGPSFKDKEILEILDNSSLIYSKLENYHAANYLLAKEIASGAVIGVFRGRAEYGPRSLGARSILADPTNPRSKQRVNLLAKRRDWFMPFAPAIIYEKLVDYLYVNQALDGSIYMQLAPKTKPLFREIAPAARHIDDSCRAQNVTQQHSPEFYDLIQKFGEISNCYALLNTSFNRHGIATIASPKQAIEHLLDGVVDILLIEDFIVYYKDNRTPRALDEEQEISEAELLHRQNLDFQLKLNKAASQ